MNAKTGFESDQWGKGAVISSGSYGKVYKGVNNLTGQPIAIKKIKTPNFHDGVPPEILREIVLLSNIDHPNVIK